MPKKKFNLYVYYTVIFFFSLAAFYSFHHIARNQSVDYLYTEKRALCFISSFLNVFVVYYHSTRAPHPKYAILLRRRLVIYAHIVSGVSEFTTCWVAFLTGSEHIATVAALTAILVHVPTAYYQTTIAFGAKALIVPAYLLVISLHLFFALHLLVEPNSIYWLLNMFLIHSIYVWCRMFYFFFTYVGVLKDSLYTSSILISTLILLPGVLGVTANLLLLGYIATSILLYFVIVRPDEQERARFVNEGTRDILVNATVHQAWIKEQAHLAHRAQSDQLTDQQLAKHVFDQLDKNKSGTIDGDEITRLLNQWQAASSFVSRFSRWSQSRDLSFELFYRHIWRLGRMSVSPGEKAQKKDSISRARFIFDHLDTDASGFIDRIELQTLLIQWGLPEDEVDAYLEGDDDKRFSFDEFYKHHKPIWNFAYENISVHDVTQVVPPSKDHSD